MKSKFLFCVALVVYSTLSFSQSGNYFLSNFTPATNNVDHVSFGIAQSDKGVLYFATKNGVIEFDGKNLSLIPTSGAVFTVFSFGNESPPLRLLVNPCFFAFTSQKPLSIHKFWPIYSKIAPDGYRISPIGDGIGKF